MSGSLRRVRLFLAGCGEGGGGGGGGGGAGDSDAAEGASPIAEAVWLLRRCPAARDAVLDFFGRQIHELVDRHLERLERRGDGGPPAESASTIAAALRDSEAPWARILASWSVDLLKDIADGHSNRSAQTLINCEAVRCLLDVITASLSRLDGEERIECIDGILSGGRCDWVIGHVGRCDPALVVPRALELALRDPTPRNVDHVVAILAHLSPSHFAHIKRALLDMFRDGLRADSENAERRKSIVPYLMQLASRSDVVLKALTKDIDVTSSTRALDDLLKACSDSVPGFDRVETRDALVVLCLRAQAPVFLLLLNWAPKNVLCRELLESLLQKMENEVRSSESKIPLLESIASDLTNIRRKLLNGSLLEKYAVARVTILIGFRSSTIFTNVVGFLLQNSRDDGTLAMLARILFGTLTMRANAETGDQSNNADALSLVRQAHENALREATNADSYPEIFRENGEHARDDRTNLEKYCRNIATLLKWEKSNKTIYLQNKPITKVSEMNLLNIACAFYDRVSDGGHMELTKSNGPTMSRVDSMSVCHSMATMIDLIDVSNTLNVPVSVRVLIKITRANVKYFFKCLHEKDPSEQFEGIQTARRIFKRNCANSKVARSVALRELLETALFRESEIFGSKTKNMPENECSNEKNKEELLMFQNHKQGPLTQLTQSHTSVFHAGVIGKGARKSVKGDNYFMIENDSATISKTSREVEFFLGALMSCMDNNGTNLEAMTSIALLLVELVSPDVMYNGLPWPDEDFTKVSIERELYIRQVFDNYPLVWHVIRLISGFRPSLCYCSVLLRAIVATLIHQYNAKSDKYIGHDDEDLNQVTVQLLDIMSYGQLLPPPLNYISQMIPHLKPNEIVQILRDCVWNYTRDTIPSPELFSRDPSGIHWRDPAQSKPTSQYTDTLRLLIQKNIANLGHLYPLMFLNVGRNDFQSQR